MNLLLTGKSSNRLHFRLVTKDDYDTWLPLFEQKYVSKFLGIPEDLSQKEQCDFWFNKVFHRYKNNLGGMNALIDINSNEFIGQAGLLIQTIEEEERLEIGYSILPKFWNRGYASEAAKQCKDFCFENNLATNLISMMHIDNIGSERVAIKNGMTFEKQVDQYKVYCVTKAQWLEQKKQN